MAMCGFLVAGLIAGAVWWRSSRLVEHTMYFSAPFAFPARDVAVAPNGRIIAVVGYSETSRKNVIWVYETGSRDARSVAGTEGASFPFWSPDGRSLGFFADGKLKRLDLEGGPAQILCDAPSGRGGTWNQEGVILFTPTGQLMDGIYRIPSSGGTAKLISPPDPSHGESSHRWPVFLPDGRHYLYLAFTVTGQTELDKIYIGSLDSDLRRFVVQSNANVAYAAPGYLLFYRDKNLFAQRFDLKNFALTEEPTPILTEIQYLPRIARAVFAVSDTRLLAAPGRSEISRSRLVWFDRKGTELGAVGKPDVFGNVSLSPNGRALATDKSDSAGQNIDLWTYELQGEGAKRLTFNPAIDAMPVWSPNATRLMFSSSRNMAFDLYLKNADGGQEEKIIEKSDADKFPSDWSHDGKYVLYTRDVDVWFMSIPELKSKLFLKAPSVLKDGQFSPDGKWVAYASNESGKWEVYVTSFPEARGKWQVSSGGGEQPRWRADGKELFYLSSDAKMMAAPVRPGNTFDFSAPIALFQASPREPVATSEHVMYDVSRDGQRFLINTQIRNPEVQPMSVVLNWDAALKKK